MDLSINQELMQDMDAAKKRSNLQEILQVLEVVLEAEGVAANISTICGSTGFRTGSAKNDSSQNVNVVQFGNHFFNTAGNKTLKTMLAEIVLMAVQVVMGFRFSCGGCSNRIQ